MWTFTVWVPFIAGEGRWVPLIRSYFLPKINSKNRQGETCLESTCMFPMAVRETKVTYSWELLYFRYVKIGELNLCFYLLRILEQ